MHQMNAPVSISIIPRCWFRSARQEKGFFLAMMTEWCQNVSTLDNSVVCSNLYCFFAPQVCFRLWIINLTEKSSTYYVSHIFHVFGYRMHPVYFHIIISHDSFNTFMTYILIPVVFFFLSIIYSWIIHFHWKKKLSKKNSFRDSTDLFKIWTQTESIDDNYLIWYFAKYARFKPRCFCHCTTVSPKSCPMKDYFTSSFSHLPIPTHQSALPYSSCGPVKCSSYSSTMSWTRIIFNRLLSVWGCSHSTLRLISE